MRKAAYIIYITILSITLYAFPIYHGGLQVFAGEGDEIYMGMFFGLVPMVLGITSFLYTLLTGDFKKMLVTFLIMFLPWVFVPHISGYILLPAFGLEAAAAGGIALLLHVCFKDRIRGKIAGYRSAS